MYRIDVFWRLSPDQINSEHKQQDVRMNDFTCPIAPGTVVAVTESHGDLNVLMYIGQVASVYRWESPQYSGSLGYGILDYKYEIIQPDGRLVIVDAFCAAPVDNIDWDDVCVDEHGVEVPLDALPFELRVEEEGLRTGRDMVKRGASGWLLSEGTREALQHD